MHMHLQRVAASSACGPGLPLLWNQTRHDENTRSAQEKHLRRNEEDCQRPEHELRLTETSIGFYVIDISAMLPFLTFFMCFC